MIQRISAAMLAIAVLASPMAAAAQDENQALAKRYIEVAKLDRQLDAVMGTMAPLSARSLIRDLELNPQSTDAKVLERMIAEVGRDTLRVMRPRFVKELTAIYADSFTEAELKGLVDFYSSDIGKQIIAKAPAFAPAAPEALEKFMPEVDDEFQRQLCLRIGCAPEEKPQGFGV